MEQLDNRAMLDIGQAEILLTILRQKFKDHAEHIDVLKKIEGKLEAIAEGIDPSGYNWHPPQPSEKAGAEWVMVSREPTEEMLRASSRLEYRMSETSVEWHRRLYAAMIAAAPTASPIASEWISIKDRLPEENGQYAVFLKPILGGPFVTVSCYSKSGYPSISGWDTSGVLSWQPLPAAPNKSDGDAE